MTDFERIAGRIIEVDGIVTLRFVVWSFDISRAEFARRCRQLVDACLRLRPKRDSRSIRLVILVLGHAEKFRRVSARRFELNPALDLNFHAEPEQRQQPPIKFSRNRKITHAEINVIEDARHGLFFPTSKTVRAIAVKFTSCVSAFRPALRQRDASLRRLGMLAIKERGVSHRTDADAATFVGDFCAELLALVALEPEEAQLHQLVRAQCALQLGEERGRESAFAELERRLELLSDPAQK